MNRHVPGHRRRERGLAAIFEPQGERPRDFTIGHRGPHPVDRRRLGQARGAGSGIGRLQRDTAAHASPRAQKLDLRPAIRAKTADLADDQPAPRATWRQGKVDHRPGQSHRKTAQLHRTLSPAASQSTSTRVTGPLFDRQARALRRDRAARRGPALFLHQRAFDDCLDRLGDVRHDFTSALLIGCPDPAWRTSLECIVPNVAVIDPGPLFAAAANGSLGDEDLIDLPPATYDLCLAIGTLDTVSDLPRALFNVRRSLRPNALFIGAVAGGETLPMLRAAMRAADRVGSAASPHVHPRIEASALAPLLSAAGFSMPVVDVDRVIVAYPGLDELIDDLRGTAATNILFARSRRPLDRTARHAAQAEFTRLGEAGTTRETFEILHFAAWTPSQG